MANTPKLIRDQWANPADILSLLLLIGGDIVQRAIAQLIGYKIRVPSGHGRAFHLSIAPVAFSFGWAAYGFSSLLSVAGQMKLMPDPDHASITVNCSNGFVRETRSWTLGRLLRNHKVRYPIDRRLEEEGGPADSIRIDIFHLRPKGQCALDLAWWLGWLTLLTQVTIASIPWALYGDWGAMLITVWGSLLVAASCAMPQWIDEKWAGRTLEKDKQKIVCLTGGNGDSHIMVFIGQQGSWDLESLAGGVWSSRPETRYLCLLLAGCWMCLLITIAGLTEHTWYLVAIGSIGMLQNVHIAGTTRRPEASNFHLTPFQPVSTIIGRRVNCCKTAAESPKLRYHRVKDLSKRETQQGADQPNDRHTSTAKGQKISAEPGSELENHDTLFQAALPSESCDFGPTTAGEVHVLSGVHGGLMELEKWVPTAGLAMVQIFFPGGLSYNNPSIRDQEHKDFWSRAYENVKGRRKVAERQRAVQAARSAATAK